MVQDWRSLEWVILIPKVTGFCSWPGWLSSVFFFYWLSIIYTTENGKPNYARTQKYWYFIGYYFVSLSEDLLQHADKKVYFHKIIELEYRTILLSKIKLQIYCHSTEFGQHKVIKHLDLFWSGARFTDDPR